MILQESRRSLITVATMIVHLQIGSIAVRADAANPTTRPLVVVADAQDVDCVRRIAGELVEFKSLFASASPSSYSLCNARAKELVDFSVYVAPANSLGPYEACWRERLTRDNPRGRVIVIPEPRDVNERTSAQRERLITVHRALANALPQCAEQLDANLQSELQRMPLTQLASDYARRAVVGRTQPIHD